MIKTLITGATGMVGLYMVVNAPKDMVITASTHGSLDSDIKSGYDCIVHLAPGNIDDVIGCARMTGARILYVSSGAVYDDPPTMLGATKKDQENRLLDSGLDVKVARIFSVAGYSPRSNGLALDTFIRKAMAGEPLEVAGGGNATRTYIYGTDLATWLWTLLLDGKKGSVYDVGGEQKVTIMDLALEVLKHFEGTYNMVDSGQGPRPNYVPDTKKIKKELGVEINVDFEEAIRLTVEEYNSAYPKVNPFLPKDFVERVEEYKRADTD